MIRALLWKEWREHRWKMLSLFLVYLAIPLGVCLSMKPGLRLGVAQEALFMLSVLVPGFLAMHTITDERHSRTLEALRALPIRREWVMLVKCVWGVITVLLPMAVVQWICILMLPGNRDRALAECTTACGLSVSLYLWSLVAGMRVRSQVLAVLMPFVVLVANYLTIYLMVVFFVTPETPIPISHLPWVVKWYIWTPVGWAQYYLGAGGMAQTLAGQCVSWVVLVAVACVRYARMHSGKGFKSLTTRTMGLRVALRGQQFPILWKTYREVRWLFLGAMMLASLFLVGEGYGVYTSQIGLVHQGRQLFAINHPRLEAMYWSGMLTPQILVGVPGFIAAVVAMVLGVEIGIRDFENRIDRFWESRPMPVGRYFAKRFMIGLALVMLVAIGPIAGAYATSLWVWGDPVIRQAKDFLPIRLDSTIGDEARYYFTVWVAAIAFLYSISVMFGVLSSRRVIALIFAAAAGVGLWMFIPDASVNWRLEDIPTRELIYKLSAVLLTAGFGIVSYKAFAGHWRERLDAAMSFSPRRQSTDGSARQIAVAPAT